jgi:hypothetical protein
MSYPSDKAVRAAIRAVIVGAAPLAKVLTRWTLGSIENSNDWPGELKAITDQQRTHGYVITREEISGEPAGSSIKGRIWTYTIFVLHYHASGNDALNSEDVFSAELDAVVAAFDLIDNANIGGAKRREPIRFRTDLKTYGGKLHHVALGTLILEPCNL